MGTSGFTRPRHVLHFGLSLLLASAIVRWAGAAIVTRVTLPDGGVGQVVGAYATPIALSPDGRYVLFASDAANVVAGDTNGLTDVFVYDRVSHSSTRASLGDDGAQPTRECYGRSFTPDGRYVAFHSAAGNLVPGDTNYRPTSPSSGWDVFVRDLVAQRTVRVSLTETGEQSPTGGCASGRLSADGRYVLFASSARLAAADTNSVTDLYLRDLTAGTTTLVSVAYSGGAANGASSDASFTPDGRYVVFSSQARNLVAGYAFGVGDSHVFVRDLLTGTTTVEDISSEGALSNAFSNAYPNISADGRYVSFTSGATNLVPNDTNAFSDIFVHDRQTRQTSRVSVSSAGEQGQRLLMELLGI